MIIKQYNEVEKWLSLNVKSAEKKKKQKQHQAMISSLKKNDEVVTAGGVHGTIVQVKDKTLGLRIDENTKIEIDKASIAYTKKAH